MSVSLSEWPAWARALYEWCLQNADKWPYVYGGGHDSSFAPSIGLTDGRYGKGYDCSGIISAALRAARILEHPQGPYGTHELEQDWGVFGFGAWATIWVANRIIGGRMVEHVVIEFPKAKSSHRFFMAYHTGGPRAGFAPFFNLAGYTAKHKR